MAQKQAAATPPYATFPTFISFLNKLKETGIPGRIEPTLFGNASGSLIYSIISSLKSMHLIDEKGTPQPSLTAFVKATDEERRKLLEKIIRQGYPALLNVKTDLVTMSAGQFDELLRDEYQINGSTIDKAAAFFIAAANYAEIPLSPHIKARKPISASPTSKKSAKQRKKDEVNENDVDPPPPPPRVQTSDIKPLEYQLIDLMSEPDIEQPVKDSIWALVQYLAARKAKKASEQ